MGEPTAQRRLVDELREVLRQLNERELSDDSLSVALQHASALRATLTGPRRARWYEAGRDRSNFDRFSMFSGRDNPVAPPVACRPITLDDGRPAIEGRVRCSLIYEGPPGGVHGGYVAGLFDEVLGGTQRLVEGGGGLTGTLTVRYRSVTPIETELRFVAWIESVRGRRISARATCHAGDVLTADAHGLFVRVDMAEVARRASDRLGSEA